MASGRTHEIINLAVLPVAVYYLQPESFVGFAGGYLAGTFFLSPDNDIFYSRPNRRWKFFRFIWYPYTKIFSHRGISHIPVLGSLLKLVYLSAIFLVPAGIFLFILYYFYPEAVQSRLTHIDTSQVVYFLKHPFTVSFLIGLVLSEIVHIATDVIYSTAKRLRLIR
ncbi:metal-binding protein [Persephonella sp.]